MLNIQKVILSNFCQHESLELELSSGLTGLFGPNGRGKSNIANAICGAFTGDFSRHSEGFKGCIRQNQPDDAFVEIHGTIAEQPFRLRRDITHKCVKHSLWLNGDKHRTYDKAGEIETWLTEVSGLTPQIMAEFLFIGQQDLYAFLETTNTELSKKFAALCGTQGYERCRNDYKDYWNKDKADLEAASTLSVEFLESGIRDTQDERENVNAAIAELREKHGDPCEKIKELETRLEKLSDRMQYLQDKKSQVVQLNDTLVKSEEGLNQRLEEQRETQRMEAITSAKCQEASKNYETMVAQFKTDWGGRVLTDVLAEFRRVQKRLAGYNQLAGQLEKAETSLQNLVKPEPFDQEKLVKAQVLKDEYSAKLNRIAERTESLEKLLHTLHRLKGNHHDALSDCPLCGADVSHWKVDLSSLGDMLAELEKEEEFLESRVTESAVSVNRLLVEQSRMDRYLHKRDSLVNEIGQFKIKLQDFNDVDMERDIDAEIDTLLAKQQEIDDIYNQYNTLQSRRVYERKTMDRLEGEITSIRLNIAKSSDTLHAIGKNESELQELLEKCELRVRRIRGEIQSFRELEKQLNILLGSKQASENRLLELQGKLAEQIAMKESQGAKTVWLEKCGKALDWLKKGGLPRLIHHSVLEQLVSTINRELVCFDDPFTVSVNDDLTFTATFPDGVRSVAKDLSGGQKVMLAMAFWSAINRTFAQNLGIMILDEPTDGLDQDNKQHLYRIMEEWAKLLRRRGQQVMVITHDTEMEESFDSVLVLEHQSIGEAA